MRACDLTGDLLEVWPGAEPLTVYEAIVATALLGWSFLAALLLVAHLQVVPVLVITGLGVVLTAGRYLVLDQAVDLAVWYLAICGSLATTMSVLVWPAADESGGPSMTRLAVPWYVHPTDPSLGHNRLLATLACRAGAGSVVANPRVEPCPGLLNLFDVTCVFGDDAAAYARVESPRLEVAPERRWHLVHGVPVDQLDAVAGRAEELGAGLAYVTGRPAPHPGDRHSLQPALVGRC